MLINHLNPEALQLCLTAREKIDREIEFIIATTSLLSQYQDCGGDSMYLDVNALGFFNALLNSKVHDIMDILEELLSLLEIKNAIRELET